MLCWGDNRRGQLGPGAGDRLATGAGDGRAGRAGTGRRPGFHLRPDRRRRALLGRQQRGSAGRGRRHGGRQRRPAAGRRPDRRSSRWWPGARTPAPGCATACPMAAGPRRPTWSAGGQGPRGSWGGARGWWPPPPRAGRWPDRGGRAERAGDNHTCARRRDGGVRCWGDNGVGPAGRRHQRPPPVAGGRRVSRDRRCACAPAAATPAPSTARRRCICWGDNRWGQLGDGSTVGLPAPVRVAGVTQVLELAAGGDLSCALTRSTALLCWGDDRQGQVGARGRGAGRRRSPPASRRPSIGRWPSPRARRTPAPCGPAARRCAGAPVRTGGWARAHRGSRRPVRCACRPVWSRCARAGRTAAAAPSIARLWCWGRGDVGQLGTGELGDRPQPVPVRGLTAVGSAGAGGGPRLCASAGDGCCAGAPAIAARTARWAERRCEPAVLGVPDGVVEIAAGEAHTCARTAAGVIQCWGAGESGQLGGPAIAFRAAPAAIALPAMAWSRRRWRSAAATAACW